jgi:mannose-6-phosphate isomerase-like protein (cupin superfamily)
MSTTLGRWSASRPERENIGDGHAKPIVLAQADSIMMFEQTVPAGTRSTFHLHRDSDEVAYVLSGEVTFKIGDRLTVCGPHTCAFMPRRVPHVWKSSGAETGRVLFLYTPARAGGLIEEQQRTGRKFGSMNERELADILQRHGWELLGPSPLSEESGSLIAFELSTPSRPAGGT